ncbi:ribonuclease [Mycobacterium kansasii]|uniref:Ribonuclease VapC n=1 Tax=Mycobacterium innocens TaxID=2341083 RepID=A0A498PPP3_9MYCO|nr:MULTISPECIES: type II toxin-antitoxin system VapC family toxin [Mycobacterium]KZS67854.1 ribonuclease [Mycobacterium kansasii]VBA35428.1 Ribonuclease VapC35 [Mycobacterium innocens]
MLYLDTSALIKLIRREPESDALAEWLDTQAPAAWVSPTLTEVELPRALRCVESGLLTNVPGLLARVARYGVDEVVRAAAAGYPDAALHSLDAIHPATAHAVFSSWLVAFVAYDERLLAAAAAVGLPTPSPGRHQS